MSSFKQAYAGFLAAVEKALPEFMPEQPVEDGGQVVVAARYSLLAGGKRLRPVLLLAACSMLGSDQAVAMPFACALEMIHTYSLIHDDLPCMDDDDLRRGLPTCHKVYGEAMAVLAGDALLNRAFEILLDAALSGGSGRLEAARIISEAAGSRGMIGGQALDLAAEGQKITASELRKLHQMKTGALIKAPVLAAASLAGAPARAKNCLDGYASAIGLGFQIKDDILDVTADSSTMGKTTGKDQRDLKPTYVSIFGLAEAQRLLEGTIASAHAALSGLVSLGYDPAFLHDLADYLLVRSK